MKVLVLLTCTTPLFMYVALVAPLCTARPPPAFESRSVAQVACATRGSGQLRFAGSGEVYPAGGGSVTVCLVVASPRRSV